MASLALAHTDAPPSRTSRLGLLHEWVVTVDHKRLGIMYVGAGLVFFVVAGLMAAVMRWQLALAERDAVSPEVFNRLFTMHGTSMVFLVGIPIVFGFANYLVPLMIGARDLALPRLNAFGFWVFLFGGLLLYGSYLGGDGLYGGGSAPAVGWFAYSPLTARAFSPGNSTDYWNLAILVTGFGTTATAINLVATTLTLRCRGMTLARMPLYVWMMLVVSGMTLLILPPLSAAQLMLLLDRFLGAHFFDTQAGGSALLWQHFFWFFGHPEVYVLMVPGFAFVSEIIPVFSRKVIFGYPTLVAASVGIGAVAMSTWAHHMFAVGMGGTVNAFFAASTMLVAIPTGVKLFNWLGTMYGGRIRLATPMLFACAFLFQFLCAGLTGVILSVAPFDWQLHDSYFVVAHFHFVLIGGLLFTIFAAIYYWFPKATGRLLDERLGRWHFWLLVVGFNLTFVPLHVVGMLGMPRRIYTYPADRGWDAWNLVASLGVPLQVAAVLIFAINIVVSLRRGARAGDDPWNAWTLEWATTSPPPAHNFDVLPEVQSRRPLWDLKHPEDPDGPHEEWGADGAGAAAELSRGRVGMVGLIIAEASLFAVFVVAYLFYIGKSLTGPIPRGVLEVPVLNTACLLGSSVTVALALAALKRGQVARSATWFTVTVLLGLAFLVGTAGEWYQLIAEHQLTIGTNLFGTTFYALVGLHASHVIVGLILLTILCVLAWSRALRPVHAERAELVGWYWHFVDAVWIVVLIVVYVIGR